MTPTEFVRSDQWKHRSSELKLEFFAVSLPILIYLISIFLGYFVLEKLKDLGVSFSMAHIFEIPDALFGGCILFCLSIVRAHGAKPKAEKPSSKTFQKIFMWRNLSFVGIIVCAIASAFAILFHERWSLGLGIFSMYCGYQCLKHVTLYRSYHEISM